MSASLVDWRLAERVAIGVAGGSNAERPEPSTPLSPSRLAATCSEAEALIRAYAQLDPGGEVPAPEALDRGEWTRSALATLRELANEIQRSGDVEISLPGPLGGIARSLVGVATGTEVGLAAGYAARRVLGQYDVSIVGADRPPRLLFVAPNLRGAASELGVDLEPFVRWVALHETTHALQFASAPWLREHIGGLVRQLLEGVTEGAGLGDLVRRVVRDPRGAISSFMRGDLAAAIAGPEQAPTLDAIQSTMTVIEGHAEHVMDAPASEFVDDVAGLRDRLEARRTARGPLETIAARLLGFDLKLRQYRLGKRFCDGVVERGGIEALNRVWEGPEALPELAELERPEAWLERIVTRTHA